MIRIVTPLLIVFALTLAACERAQETGEMEEMAADTAAAVSAEAQIDSLRMNYETAWNARDNDAVLAMMTSDYEEIGPEGTMNYEQVRAMMTDTAHMAPEGATLSIEFQTLEVAESGDVAYGNGLSTVTTPGADGQEGMTETLQWMAGFQKVDGQWKIDRLAFAPAVAAEPAGDTEDAGEDTTGTM